MQQMNPADEVIFKVDKEHFSIRFLVPILTLIFTVAFHLVAMRGLASLEGEGISPLCLVLPLDVLAFVVGGFVIEQGLKLLLPSRRYVKLNDDELVFVDEKKQPARITRLDWYRTLNVSAWRFEVRRRTRIPKGWYCMAIYLLQDEEDVILYSFMPPEEAEALVGYDNFVRLRPRKETTSSADLSANAEQRRLLKLEDARWSGGAEMGRDHFQVLLEAIDAHVRGWR